LIRLTFTKNKKGAYFFVMDAVIAGAVLVAALLFIFSSFSSAPERDTIVSTTEDFSNYLHSTTMRQYSSPAVNAMIEDGNITNLDNTIAAQIVEFYQSGKVDEANNLTADVARSIVPADRGLIIEFQLASESLIYNSTFHKDPATLNSSSLVISAKRLTFRLVNETTLFGPVWVEVKVWA
jgi:hypothetical protein